MNSTCLCIYAFLFLMALLIAYALYKQTIEGFAMIEKRFKSDLLYQPRLAIQSKLQTKEGFGAMGPMLPELSSKGLTTIELSEEQKKRYQTLEKGCQHKREKCYIASSIESCNVQYEGCLQDALWDAKINTGKNEYVPPTPAN